MYCLATKRGVKTNHQNYFTALNMAKRVKNASGTLRLKWHSVWTV